MGQAKNRGTFAQRKEQAVALEEERQAQMAAERELRKRETAIIGSANQGVERPSRRHGASMMLMASALAFAAMPPIELYTPDKLRPKHPIRGRGR